MHDAGKQKRSQEAWEKTRGSLAILESIAEGADTGPTCAEQVSEMTSYTETQTGQGRAGQDSALFATLWHHGAAAVPGAQR